METQTDSEPYRPPPTDFDNFLPWACRQLSLESIVVVTRKVQSDYVSLISSTKPKPKIKPKKPASEESPDTNMLEERLFSSSQIACDIDSKINLETIYDGNLNLVQLKFLKNKPIPRLVFKIIALIIQYHTSLTSITINSGLHMGAIYEISKFLHLSQITELNFDQTFLIEANYHILLDQNSLKHLSLSKCNINDAVVETIACKLMVPCPAARTLSVLNLATNKITDLGVKYLADALRTNRQLSYLNLADNLITDGGATRIFDSLVDFSLTSQEWKERKARYLIYLKKKVELIQKTVKEVRDGDLEKKITKKKVTKGTTAVVPPPKKNKGAQTDNIMKTVDNKSLMNVEAIHYERAEAIVKEKLGPFQDPFDSINTQTKDGEIFCLGNNSLCYLNLAYNNLTYISLKKLHEVLLRQRFLGRTPMGLLNVIIEGNYLPEVCEELQEIDDLLEARFSFKAKMPSPGTKKKRISKTGVR